MHYTCLGFLLLGLSNSAVSQDTISIGISTVGNGTSSYPCPIQDYYEGGRNQYLYRASELSAAGMTPGYITQASFFALSANSSGTFPAVEGFEFKIGTTTSNTLVAGAWNAGPLTSVYGPANYSVTAGANLIPFTTSFYWNGCDNIIIETCNGDAANTTATYWTNNSSFAWTTGLGFNASRTYRADNQGSLCGYTGTTENGTTTTRPNITFYASPAALVPAHDVAVVSVSELLNQCATGGDSATITIANYGSSTEPSIPILLSVNGSAYSLVSTFTDTLFTCGNATFNIPLSGFSGTGAVNIAVTAALTTDSNATNDSASVSTFKFSTITGGTYTLGGGGADYQSFAQLSAQLSTCGISGPVVINVNPSAGPYMEQVLFDGVIGLSAANTLTINGNGAHIEYDGTFPDYRIVGFGQNMKHITIDSLHITELGTSTSFGVHFASGADSNAITNSIIDFSNITVNSTTVLGILVSGSNTSYTTTTAISPRDLLIEGNTILGGASGGAYLGIALYSGGATNNGFNNIIRDNTIENIYNYGIRASYQDGLIISGNDISSEDRTVSTTKYMISCELGMVGAEIFDNYLHDPFGGVNTYTGTFYGIFFNAADATGASPNNIYNNIIGKIESNGAQYGIYNSGSDYTSIDHNTISLDYAGGSGTTTYAFYQTTTATGINLRNNLFSVTRPGAGSTSAAALRFNTTSSSIVSNNNVLFIDTNITNIKTGYYGSTAYQNLVNWQTANTSAYDANSVQANPVFADPSGGDFTPLALAVDNFGIPLGVTTDFYGASRSLSAPDVGAIEFTGIPGDIALTNVTLSQQNICYGTNDTVSVTVNNVLGSTVNFATAPLSGSWSVVGPVASSGTFTINTGTLTEGSSLTIDLNGANMSAPGVYTVSANIDTNSINAAGVNDTLWNHATNEVAHMLTVSPLFDTITSPFDSVLIQASSPLFPGGAVKFSEITHFKTTTGGPLGGWPAWVADDDNLELIGAPSATLAGYTIERYLSNSATPAYSFTFFSNAQFDANGVAYLGWGGTAGSVDPINNYYRAGISGTALSSSTVSGYVVRDPNGNILDAVVIGTSFTWNAATGVTSSDWAANMGTTATSTSGIRRTAATDNNTGTDWQVATGTLVQDPGAYNNGVNAIIAPATPGITWTLSGVLESSNPSFYGGPWTTNGNFTYVATLDSTCGIFVDSAQIHVNLTTAVITASTNILCNGDATGSATAASTGGDAPFTYAWNNGDSTASISNLVAGLYTVTVTDANGRADSVSVTLSEPAGLVNSFTIVPSGCGAANGSATASVSGGIAPYTYAWSGSTSTLSLAGTLSSGTYQLTVTDANGCALSDTATVNDAGAPTVTFTITDAINCFGGSDGEITAGVSGGATPYSYAWSAGGSTTNVANGLTSGSYILTVTDNLGCAVSGTQAITEPSLLTAISLVGSNTSCNGTSDGSATVVAAGGTTSYTYVWNNGATTAAVTGLAANTYMATVTDANGCIASTAPISITEPAVLATTIAVINNVSCNGLSDGSLTAASTGGTTTYSYLWSNGTAAAANSGLAAASYTVTTTDANGCTATATNTITEPTVLAASITGSNNATCFGFSDGDATAFATGGTTAYTYNWSSSATSAQANGLAAGSYTVTITDANGCTDAESVTIGEPTMLTASIIDTTDVTCFGFVDGASEVAAAGGTTPYSFLWTNGSTTAVAIGFGAGLQSVTVTDINNCTVTESVLVSEPTQLMNSFSVVNLSCNNSNDGEAVAAASGSVAPYLYIWSNAATADTISGLSAGNYFLTITDENGCILTDSVTVTQPDSLISVVDNIADLDCNGAADGTVTVSAIGGTMPYSYLWDNTADSSSIIGLSGGTYSATVTDDNGCTSEISAMVHEPELLTSSLTAIDASCFGLSDGSIANAVEGGTAPYSYEWSNSSVAADLTDVGAGSYSVTVTDTNGCLAEATADISEPDSIDNGASITIANAIVSLTASADSAAYQWIDCASGLPVTGADAKVFIPQANGSYSVIVTVGTCSDTSDCQDVGSVGVNYVSNNNSMSIFPNPTRDNFNLKFEGEFGNDIRIDIVDVHGKLVSSRIIMNVTNGHVETINALMSSGVYFVRAFNYDQLIIQRLIVN